MFFKYFITTIALVVIIAIFTLPINVFAKDNKPIHCVDRDDKKISLSSGLSRALPLGALDV